MFNNDPWKDIRVPTLITTKICRITTYYTISTTWWYCMEDNNPSEVLRFIQHLERRGHSFPKFYYQSKVHSQKCNYLKIAKIKWNTLVLGCIKLAELERHFPCLLSKTTNVEGSRLELTINRILIWMESWQGSSTHVYPGKEDVSLGTLTAPVHCRWSAGWPVVAVAATSPRLLLLLPELQQLDQVRTQCLIVGTCFTKRRGMRDILMGPVCHCFPISHPSFLPRCQFCQLQNPTSETTAFNRLFDKYPQLLMVYSYNEFFFIFLKVVLFLCPSDKWIIEHKVNFL